MSLIACFGAVGEVTFSKSRELGSGGGDRPLDRVQRRCADAHPIRAGLVRFPQGQERPLVDGMAPRKGSYEMLPAMVSMKSSP